MTDTELHPVNDPTDRQPEAGIALCLSGGGYRAMMFHAGVLWRLNDLGLLGALDRISSVSGGSIIAAVIGMNWAALNVVRGQPSAGFVSQVITPIRKMASTTVDEGAILGGIFLPGSISDHVTDKYGKILFGTKTLQDLPDVPRFVLNATNVQSGVLMRFSKPYIWDYRVGQVLKPAVPLARVVAASSAFPPVLSPCEFKAADYKLKFEPARPGEDLNFPPYTTDFVLSDGGVYDNLGLETAWKRYDTVLVSDAGAHFKPESSPHSDWARHSFRVLDLIDSQVRALRTRQIIALYKAGERKGCYWSIRQPYPAAPVGTLTCPPDKTRALAETATRLKEMEPQLQERLINWGYAICDVNLRTYFDPKLPPAQAFPFPASGV